MKRTTDKAALLAAKTAYRAEAAEKEARAKKEAARAELHAKMDALGVDELQAGEYVIRRTTTAQIRVDVTRLKKEAPEVAAEYAKQTTVHHFNISKK